MKIGDFVKPANPNHPQRNRVMRLISERDGFFCAAPLSNHPEWSIEMKATGFVAVDPPRGWENFKPVTQV
jgi:hypothetical protein